jgi:hypothetical protein
VPEVLLHRLAPEAALGRQLAVGLVQRAVEDGEVHHPLVGREEAVGGGDQRAQERAQRLGPPARQRGLAGEVRPDEQGVELAPVADEEGLGHGVEVAEEVLHALRGDGLALEALVDLLLAPGEPVVAALVHRDEVAGAEPALRVHALVPVGRAVVAAHDVRPAQRQLAVGGDLELDARQRLADGALDVVAGRGHGHPAGGLGHAVARAQLDPGALEGAEDARVEEARRRQAEAQPPAGQLAQPVRHALGVVLAAGLLHRPLVQLEPLLRDADEGGGPHRGEVLEQRGERRRAREDVLRAGPQRAQQLQPAAEGVEERQVRQEGVPLAEGGQREGPAQALGDEVVVGEGDALGRAGGARGVHDRRQVGRAHAGAARVEPARGRRAPRSTTSSRQARACRSPSPGETGTTAARSGRPACAASTRASCASSETTTTRAREWRST